MKRFVASGVVILAALTPGSIAAQGPRLSTPPTAWQAPRNLWPSVDVDSVYSPRAWKKGALIGAGAGVVLGVIAYSTCQAVQDSGSDCSFLRAEIVGVLVGAGLGALIGGLFPT